MLDRQRAPRLFVLLSAAVAVLALVAMLISLRAGLASLGPALLILAVSAMVSENYSLEVPGFSLSLAYPLTMSALLLSGPVGAGLVAAVTSVKFEDLRSGKPVSRTLYNLGQCVFISCASGWLYLSLGGRVLQPYGLPPAPLTGNDFPGILVPLATVAFVCAVGNMLLTVLAMSTLYGRPSREALNTLVRYVPSMLAFASVGFLFAQVLAVRVAAFPLFAFPLFLAMQLYQRYESLRSAYADTVRSLVNALEAKDPYTRGHSERVASYALELGRQAGLDKPELERVEYAALLHDIGKLAVPAAVLLKSESLTEDERETIRQHPIRGADMVSKIPPLRDLQAYVRGHHEYFSGGGYPHGSDHEDIPMGARILAVADSFDAMTTTRPYRPAMSRIEALRELEKCAGKQFDPALVVDFILAHSFKQQEAVEYTESSLAVHKHVDVGSAS